ncbi:MAG: flagellar protein FliS [Candidatus Neomarinimicrobiota bacterium]|nr:flagellar protein FliS [Candidatus Neomarinimicrobiota bacterium]MCD6100209.1 flagellar protein FliS [Candidatus Neomarinimicrobiota bacterium]RKY47767.1 MAG: flagellar protein FliS [Candidatus Neomarinimicrobiota bacterium]RKY53181.1 MAG: flagellar protein FliS [Candidatus Neomarinimicrobiota bacterium]
MTGFSMTKVKNSKIKNTNPYLVQKIMTASPEELVDYVYDFAIRACKTKNRVKACEAIQTLINSLNFDEKETATTFYRVYRYILKQIHEGNFTEAEQFLTELRKTWAKAMKIKID